VTENAIEVYLLLQEITVLSVTVC